MGAYSQTYGNYGYATPDTKTASLDSHTRKWTVAYNKGASGTGTNVSDTKVYGTNLTLRGAIFTRTGYTQDGWSTSDGGAKAYELYATYTTNAAVTLYPHWSANSYAVTVTAGTDITSVSGAGSYTYGSSVTVDAVLGSDPGYTYAFDGWYDGDTKVSSSQSYTFTMPANAVSLTAKATKTANDYILSLTAGEYIASVGGGGTITYGDSVTVTAVLDVETGYTITFDGWYAGDTKVSSSLSYTFSMPPNDYALTARGVRTINSYSVNLTAGNFITSVSGGGTKVYNSSVTVSAVLGSASGYAYSFLGWYDGTDTLVSSSQSYTFTMPANAVTLTAKGSRAVIPYTLSVSAGTGTTIAINRTNSPNAGASTGAITAADPIYYGDVLAVTFTAVTGYDIATRTINGNAVSATVNYTVVGNTSIAATATPQEYTLHLNISNSGVVASVNRMSSPIGGAPTDQIFDNATLYYGDVLLISYSFGLGYQVDAHTINGADFDSGDSYTVVGDTVVIVTASASGFVYINNRPYLAYIGDSTNWRRYQAQIGDGSNWVAH